MNQELIFRNTLEELVKTARRQGMYLAEGQVEETFPELSGKEEKLNLVYEYLKNQHIAIGEESDLEQFLSDEDKNFLEQYLCEIKEKAEVTAEEKKEIILSAMADSKEAEARLLEIYLPDVAQIAKLYTGQGVYLEDLIGEGNVALTMAVSMLGCLEGWEEADGYIAKFIMDAMEKLVEDEAEEAEADEKVLNKVNEVAKAAKELSDELLRKVSVDELSIESGISKEDIYDALRMTSNQIDDIDLGEKDTV